MVPSFVTPILNGIVSSGWGDDRSYRGGTHEGIDFHAPIGTDVVAVADGTVTKVDSVGAGNAGKYVAITHDGGYTSRYMHLSQIDVSRGDEVDQGQHIGYSGATGIKQSAAHLHFDMQLLDSQLQSYADIFGAPDGGWGTEHSPFGRGVPSEPLIPANYTQDVIDNASDYGFSIASGLGAAGFLLLAGLAYLAWRYFR